MHDSPDRRTPEQEVRWTSSAEAAERLGVKVETLYAYVSRGHLTSHRRPGRAGTWFAVPDIERFARRTPPRNSASRRPFAFRGVSTRVSSIDAGDLLYRGRDAVALAEGHRFEEVASWLLTGETTAPTVALADAVREEVVAMATAVSGDQDPLVRLKLAVTVAGARDPFRSDLSEAGLARSSALILDAMLSALSGRCAAPSGAAATCVTALGRGSASADLAPAVDQALTLLIDHGLASSTVAARVAASTRADPYAVVLAGLAALSGPLHGAASEQVHRLLTQAAAGDAETALATHVRHAGGVLLGFARTPYPDGDPRATALLTLLASLPGAERPLESLRRVQVLVGADTPPTIDSALAVLTLAGGWPPTAGEVVFALARSVGWIAHAAEEYGEAALRWRAR